MATGALSTASDPWADVRRSIGRMKASPIDIRAAMAGNPNEVNPTARSTGDVAWGNVPGLERFYSYDAQNNAERFNMNEALPEIERLGYQVMQGFDPESETSATWVVGPDGEPIVESARVTGTNDDRFKLAALAAMGVTGANIIGAGLGASAAPGAGGAAAEGGAGALMDYGVGSATLDGATGWGLTEGAGAAASGAGSAVAGDATKASLLSNAGYGTGMTGAETSVFDGVLNATGSTTAAKAATDLAGSVGMDWLDTALSTGKSVFGNDWLTTAMSLVGAGVNQMNIEKAAQDQRDWLDQKDIDRRRRQAPGALPAMKTTVYTKGGG